MIVLLINHLFGYRIQTSTGEYLKVKKGLLTLAKTFTTGSDFIKFKSHDLVQIKDHSNIAIETKSNIQLTANYSDNNSNQLFSILPENDKPNTIKILKVIRGLSYCFTHTGETITLNACIKNSPEQFFKIFEENPEEVTERNLAAEKAREEFLKQEEHIKREKIIAEELEDIKEAKRQALEDIKEQKRIIKEAKWQRTKERLFREAEKAKNIFQRLWDQMKAFRSKHTEPLPTSTLDYTQPKIESKITDAPSQIPEIKKDEPITLPDINYAEKLFENDHEQNNDKIIDSELNRILKKTKEFNDDNSKKILPTNWNTNKKSHTEIVPEAVIFNGDAEPIGTNQNSSFVRRSLHNLQN